MQTVSDVAELEAIYGEAMTSALAKVVDHITPSYQRWIHACRFLILSTVGPEGTDASPRGDVDPVVVIEDPKTLLMPDWRGNNRMDSLRNIVRDGRVSLMFMLPGSNNVIRVNGQAAVTVDSTITQRFEQNGKHPRSVVVVTVKEVYFQCAKALMRSALWSGEDLSGQVPTAGDFRAEQEAGFDGAEYDRDYANYAAERMW